MTEELLHHLWKFRLFDQLELVTTTNDPLEIVKVGDHNQHAGPDFFNSKIKIAETLWAGNVEVHIRASDWNKHRHQQDKAYDNIILHVVYEADQSIFRSSGEAIPTLELKQRIEPHYLINYQRFKLSNDWIACEKQLKEVPPIVMHTSLNRLLIERLEEKYDVMVDMLRLNKMNWEETFYQLLAKNFGFKTNALPFQLLAKSIPSTILAKHKSSLLQAGFLEQHFNDKYSLQLQNEYVFLKQKFKLVPIENHLWKFLRLRPVNFPTIRIAQFAQLIYQSNHLFSKIIEEKELLQLKKLMETTVSAYWRTHYVFEKMVTGRNKKLGEDSIDNIIMNTIIPFLFVYGKAKGDESYIERALRFMEEMEGEKNTIINTWKSLDIPVKSAAETQALLQLKNKYCDHKKCLACSIGNYLLKKS
jgi:hypothetical protein